MSQSGKIAFVGYNDFPICYPLQLADLDQILKETNNNKNFLAFL